MRAARSSPSCSALVDEPVTDDELARARALIEASELGALGRVEEVADRISMYAALFDDPQLVNEQLRRYLAVTAADIQNGRARCLPRRQPRGADVRAAHAGGGSGVTLEDQAEQGFTTDQEAETDSTETAEESTGGLTPDALLVDEVPAAGSRRRTAR